MLRVGYSISGSRVEEISPVLTGLCRYLQDGAVQWQLRAKTDNWWLLSDRPFPIEKLNEALKADKAAKIPVPVPLRMPSKLEQRQEEMRAQAVPDPKVTRCPRSLAERQAALKAKMLGAPQTYGAAGTEEIPFTVEGAAPYWGQSPKATRDHFRDLPGVRVIPSPPSYVGGRRKRAYETVLIPPTILLREIDKSTKKLPKKSTK